jgi:hypothetical protein
MLQLKVSSASHIQCKISPFTPSLQTDITTSNPADMPIGGAFYIRDATSISDISTLTLENCYSGDTGGAYTLINTSLKDRNSLYRHNGAYQGGAIYCSDCLLDLDTITFDHHEAFDGGTFYLQNLRSGAVMAHLTVSSSIAY